jgi:hypothetical protein
VGKVDPAVLVTVVVAGAVFWIAYDDGSYALPSRAALAIVVLWAVIVGVALQLLGPTPLPASTLVVGGLMLALACWTLASVLWAPSAEDAFNELNRVALYVAVFVFTVLAASRRTVGRWADGLAVAISAVAFVALVSRLFPETFPDRELATYLPSAATRLSFPLGYWNGLAIFVGLGIPLLLRLALVARTTLTRGLALAPVPAIASVIYLASSRGGVLTALVGAFVFVLLTDRRWNAAAAILVSGAASAAAIAALADRNELVNGPLGTERVRDQGQTAAVLIGLCCAAAAVAFGLGCRFLRGRLRPRAAVGRVAASLAALTVVAGIVASDPVSRFETFKTSPQELEAIDSGDFVTAHLLSGGGSGRWQFWSSAIDQSREHPVVGEGAGSYEHWWAEHASFTYSLKDAHSLYLETLGELGHVGFVLVVALALVGASIGVRRSLQSGGDARVTTAAATAVFVAYATAAAFDWIWELTAVSVVGLATLALVSGRATDQYEPLRRAESHVAPQWATRHRFGLGVVTVLTAWLLIFAQAIPLLADREIARSQAAVDEHDLEEGIEAAEDARDIQPWASSPYLQLALVSESRGELPRARAWIEEAIERDSKDWQLWLVSARLETKLGNVAFARRSLLRAAELNPRSPLFAGLVDQLNPSD